MPREPSILFFSFVVIARLVCYHLSCFGFCRPAQRCSFLRLSCHVFPYYSSSCLKVLVSVFRSSSLCTSSSSPPPSALLKRGSIVWLTLPVVVVSVSVRLSNKGLGALGRELSCRGWHRAIGRPGPCVQIKGWCSPCQPGLLWLGCFWLVKYGSCREVVFCLGRRGTW